MATCGGGTVQTVMLVDDDPDILECYEEILRTCGYRVISQLSGTNALSVIQSGILPDLVVTDYKMPDMNGLELIRQLGRIAPFVPAILMTGHVDHETHQAACGLGVDCIQKPNSGTNLAGIIRRALDTAKKRNES